MQVKVWNDNIYPHSEKMKGTWYEIAAGGFITMDEDEAHQFLGQFTPMKKRGDGTADPRTFKKLRIEHLEKKKTDEPNPLMFHATGQIAKSIEELKSLQSQYAHLMPKDESGDKSEKVEALVKENDELKSRLSNIEQMLASMAEKKKSRKAKETVTNTEDADHERQL